MPDTPAASRPTPSRAGAVPPTRASAPATPPPRSWLGAIALGIAGAALIGVLLLWIPHLMIKRLPAGSRDLRVALATLWMLGATTGLLLAGLRLGRGTRSHVGSNDGSRVGGVP